MKKKYEEMSKQILKFTGGADNISKFAHCATRLRFTVKDKDLVDEELKNVEGVIGIRWTGEQLQIIIGNAVSDVYSAICEIGGLKEEAAIEENLDTDMVPGKLTLKGIFNRMVAYISGSAYSMIALLAGASMFATLNAVLGPNFLKLYSAESDIYILFDFMYDIVFYFLPIILGYTAAKTLKVNPLLGIYIGAMIIVPDFMNMVDVRESFTVLGLRCPVANYSQTFFPVILGVWVMSYVYKFVKKIVPEVLSFLFVPFLTMLVMAPVMFCACAPLGAYVGEVLGAIFTFLGASGGVLMVLGFILLGGIMPYITIGGMHSAVYMPAIVAVLSSGSEAFVMVIGQTFSWTVYGLALGAWFKYKKKENKTVSLSYLTSGLIGGISEPILYAIGLNSKRNMLIMGVVGAASGLAAAFIRPVVYNMSMATVFTIVTEYAAGGVGNMVRGGLLNVLSFALGAIAIALFGEFKEGENV